MAYTDLTSAFVFKGLLTYQRGNQLIANDNFLKENLMNYRRPNLVYVDGQYVDVENNVPSDANATRIIFPDGDVRTVSEDVSLTNIYRRLDRTANYSLTAAHESGAGSPSDNNWVAVYAVKTSDDATKFVLCGSTTIPKRIR